MSVLSFSTDLFGFVLVKSLHAKCFTDDIFSTMQSLGSGEILFFIFTSLKKG